MNINVNIITKPSAPATSINGAQGAILSKAIPPKSTKRVVPADPKKKAIPLRVPRTVLFILRRKTTSTARNCMREVTTSKMQSVMPSVDFGLSTNLNSAATMPRAKKADGTRILASTLSEMLPKIGMITIAAIRLPIMMLRYTVSASVFDERTPDF